MAVHLGSVLGLLQLNEDFTLENLHKVGTPLRNRIDCLSVEHRMLLSHQLKQVRTVFEASSSTKTGRSVMQGVICTLLMNPDVASSALSAGRKCGIIASSLIGWDCNAHDICKEIRAIRLKNEGITGPLPSSEMILKLLEKDNARAQEKKEAFHALVTKLRAANTIEAFREAVKDFELTGPKELKERLGELIEQINSEASTLDEIYAYAKKWQIPGFCGWFHKRITVQTDEEINTKLLVPMLQAEVISMAPLLDKRALHLETVARATQSLYDKLHLGDCERDLLELELLIEKLKDLRDILDKGPTEFATKLEQEIEAAELNSAFREQLEYIRNQDFNFVGTLKAQVQESFPEAVLTVEVTNQGSYLELLEQAFEIFRKDVRSKIQPLLSSSSCSSSSNT
ncbi:MAG: hypothetical protein JSS61_06085 [Verrucomicrobia bacterium]|nr:hypothetical protein [Verrucomicrobiota bacterium]